MVAVIVTVSPVEPPEAEIVGVVSVVLLSVLELPRSELVARSGIDGAAGRTDKLPVPDDEAKDPLLVGARLAPISNDPDDVGVYVMVVA